ncbi:MAG: hypothetical protein HC897_14095 [Thermoanaerobaculia bacterium]|nr:hypothetical protein [Thermoanaerobaculia bacterium]
MKMRHALLILFVTGLTMVGCNLAVEILFDHAPAGESVDIEPFLGHWSLTEAFGYPVRHDASIEAQLGPEGQPRVFMTEDSETIELTVVIVRIAADLFVSLESEGGRWHVFKMKIEDQGRRILLQSPDFDLLKHDVRGGSLAGEIDQLDYEEDFIIVHADSSGLEAYLNAKAAIFTETVVVLSKSRAGSTTEGKSSTTAPKQQL